MTQNYQPTKQEATVLQAIANKNTPQITQKAIQFALPEVSPDLLNGLLTNLVDEGFVHRSPTHFTGNRNDDPKQDVSSRMFSLLPPGIQFLNQK